MVPPQSWFFGRQSNPGVGLFENTHDRGLGSLKKRRKKSPKKEALRRDIGSVLRSKIAQFGAVAFPFPPFSDARARAAVISGLTGRCAANKVHRIPRTGRSK